MEAKVIDYNNDVEGVEDSAEAYESHSVSQGKKLFMELSEIVFSNSFDTAKFSAVAEGGFQAICTFIINDNSVSKDDAEINAKFLREIFEDTLRNTLSEFSNRSIN